MMTRFDAGALRSIEKDVHAMLDRSGATKIEKLKVLFNALWRVASSPDVELQHTFRVTDGRPVDAPMEDRYVWSGDYYAKEDS